MMLRATHGQVVQLVRGEPIESIVVGHGTPG
jgi:hypothetical protein